MDYFVVVWLRADGEANLIEEPFIPPVAVNRHLANERSPNNQMEPTRLTVCVIMAVRRAAHLER